MQHKVLRKAVKYVRTRQVKKRWQSIVTGIAAVVVFCTIYAMILPAITAEKEAKLLKCSLSVHQHTDDCYDDDGELVCGKADYVVHTHDENCWDEDGNLLCLLPEIQAHMHAEDCYRNNGELICEEAELHKHINDCYEDGNLVCGKLELQEHVHEEGCFQHGAAEQKEEVSDNLTGLADENVKGNLIDYIDGLKKKYGEHSASLKLTVKDTSGNIITPDANGKYNIVQPYCGFALEVFSVSGFDAGKYIYQMPEGLLPTMDYIEHLYEIKQGETTIGTYIISSEGLITVQFLETEVTNVTGYVTAGLAYVNEAEDALPGSVEKTGGFDGATDKFKFTITTVVPACDKSNEKLKQYYIWDQTIVSGLGQHHEGGMWNVDLTNAVIEAKHAISVNGEISTDYDIPITKVEDAAETDKIAYYYVNNSDIYLVNRCDGTCDEKDRVPGVEGWCKNWHYDKNIVLTIQYEERRSADIIDLGSGDKYSQGNLYINKAQVGEQSAILTPEIPHLIDKKMDEQATVNNDYTASFTIQVNPSKVDLSGRKNLVITDELNNLTYIPGTMTITRSDGKVLDLDEFVVDASENNTKLAITLEQAVLGAYSYDVKYKAKLTEMSDSGNGQTKYSNTAVYNNGPSSTSEGSVHFDQNWSWDTLSLKLIKYNKDTKELLPGAEFGIYTANGRLMGPKTTDEDGIAIFQTEREHGIFLLRGYLYYLQEIKAPDKCMLDTTKHWFYFGSELPDNAPEGTLLIKVPENGAVQGEMKVANEPFYELPETGGPGTILYTISGIILMGGALMYCIYQWRRRGRCIE